MHVSFLSKRWADFGLQKNLSLPVLAGDQEGGLKEIPACQGFVKALREADTPTTRI